MKNNAFGICISSPSPSKVSLLLIREDSMIIWHPYNQKTPALGAVHIRKYCSHRDNIYMQDTQLLLHYWSMVMLFFQEFKYLAFATF
ncbi:MAG: hypothetical protein PUD22_00775 [Erysipelotrichaceae bacterium]|nr:hypothetical protein [Erysipelotrichaceae bacterium]